MSIHTLMFGWEYPPLHLGGLGVACQGLVQGLLKNGVHVTLVLPHPHAQSEEHDVISPKEHRIRTVKVQSMLNPYMTTDQYFRQINAVSKEMQQVYGSDLPQAVTHFAEVSVELTKHTSPDVVHCHDWMTYGAGIRAAKHHRKPLITHIHATELDRTHFHPDEWIYGLERQGFQAADRIVAVSNYTKNILVEHYGIDPAKIMVVHNGSSEEHLRAPQKLTSLCGRKHAPMVLFLGRLTLQKGPIQFLEMADKVRRFRPDTQFIMAGEGGMMEEIVQKVRELNLQENVALAGKVSSAEARKLYRKADCFVMPSLSEPFGLVALEAIAHGTPVVISKQSGVSEVVGHGFKVDFWDTEKMADCVLTILREQPLANQLRTAAPRSLQYLRWENQAKHVRSIYEKLIR
ncbi:MAG: glycosyltransferase family 4 protein [Candidatus Peribacteraceae bacterium]|nr:glycosyltransferase family 4 protein [Candidatus Peribacteraceae bacterium]